MDKIIEYFRNLWMHFYDFITDPRFVTTILVVCFVYILLALLTVFSKWKLYEKAGYPGWTCLIPHVDDFVLIRVAGFSGWYFPLTFVQTLDAFTFLALHIMLARAFHKSGWFGVGLYLCPLIFYPILYFSLDQYTFPKYSARAKIRQMFSSKQLPGG